MYPQSLDYGSPVQYRTNAGIEPLANDSWSRAEARFSDDLSDTTEAVITLSGLTDDHAHIRPFALDARVAPNPFSATASIEIGLRVAGHLRADIFDVRGALVQTVVSGTMSAGTSRITWDGRDGGGVPCPSGLYFCRISSGRRAVVQKLLLIR